MKSVKLIKRIDVVQQSEDAKSTEQKVAAETPTAKNPVEVVRGWVKERKANQKQQARQLFTSLFA
jgi:hypothetical protein